ncbi:MAG: MBL fold metallo-hydrolase [Clostridia bacterium]|nr:MBL fold metallo-hydrolase [Clostridia bacterium]
MSRQPVTRSRVSIFLIAIFLSVAGWFSLNPTQRPQSVSSPEGLSVQFIDVGQADSILIQQDDSSMLIDAGNNEDTDDVVKYLKKHDVVNLTYLIGTHPHEDHIGGLDGVIKNFNIETLIMPRTQTNTKTFEDVLKAVKRKGLTITTPVVGKTYSLGEASFTILSPSRDTYDELNEYSIAIRLVYKDKSFLLMGDCYKLNEEDMLASGMTLKSDVLKVGHHGSSTSSSEAFIKAVSPKYAVITVGKDNDYDHPSDQVVSTLENHQVELYRTDKNGTIIFTTDGENIDVKAQKP